MIQKLSFVMAIQSSATVSNALSEENLRHAVSVCIYPPATLDAQIFSLEASPVDGASASGSDYRFLTTSGSNITFNSDKAVVVTSSPFRGLRVSADGATASARSFDVIVHAFR